MYEVVLAIPSRWALTGSGQGRLGRHTGFWEGPRLRVRASSETRYIEQLLAELFLDHLGDRTSSWLQPWEQARLTAAAADDVLAVAGPTIDQPGWHDRYLFSADAAHRLLFERRWDRDRAGTCVWVLINAGTGDLLQREGGRRRTTSRGNLGTAIGRTQTWAEKPPSDAVDWRSCGSVTVVNLFTARSTDVISAGRSARTVGAVAAATQLNHRLADRILSRAFDGATAVVGAWGGGAASLGRPSRTDTVERMAAAAGQTLFGVKGTRAARTVRWLTEDLQPRYTRAMPSDAVPVPLDLLRADTSLTLP
jgi:hypothetical protein